MNFIYQNLSAILLTTSCLTAGWLIYQMEKGNSNG